jgi:uronate dehydrogenase
MGKTFSIPMTVPKKYQRVLLTGAAGGLGKVLREGLKPFTNVLRVSDREPLGEAKAGEEVVHCDLADKAAVDALVKGCDAIAHFGGVSTEGKFEPILQANIVGVFNVYEAARRHGVKRVVFASSNHVVGYYRQTDVLDADVPQRPDGLYGVSKCFGESLSRFYHDRHGIETACLRIGSSFPEPRDRRMLSTYLSYPDLVELVRACLFAPRVWHTVIYGVSDNKVVWWDNGKAGHIGFKPRDSSEKFRERVEAAGPPLPADDPAAIYQGGAFVHAGPFDD